MTINKKNTPDEPTFESTIESLESLVKVLESPDTPLEKSLQAYESSVRLIQTAQSSLSAAEQKVHILAESTGDIKTIGDSGSDE